MTETPYRVRLIAYLEDVTYWETRGLGPAGLIRDYARLEHSWDDLTLESSAILDELKEMQDWEIESPADVTTWLHDRACNEHVYDSDQTDAVTLAGVDECFRFLLNDVGHPRVDSLAHLYDAVYMDMHNAIEQAYTIAAEEVDEMEDEEEV